MPLQLGQPLTAIFHHHELVAQLALNLQILVLHGRQVSRPGCRVELIGPCRIPDFLYLKTRLLPLQLHQNGVPLLDVGEVDVEIDPEQGSLGGNFVLCVGVLLEDLREQVDEGAVERDEPVVLFEQSIDCRRGVGHDWIRGKLGLEVLIA